MIPVRTQLQTNDMVIHRDNNRTRYHRPGNGGGGIGNLPTTTVPMNGTVMMGSAGPTIPTMTQKKNYQQQQRFQQAPVQQQQKQFHQNQPYHQQPLLANESMKSHGSHSNVSGLISMTSRTSGAGVTTTRDIHHHTVGMIGGVGGGGSGMDSPPFIIVDDESNEVSLAIIDEAFGRNCDLYNDILGISAIASMDQIQDAYFERRNELFNLLSEIDERNGRQQQQNPDQVNTTNQNNIEQYRYDTERKLDAVVGAVRILRDPELRLQYDELRQHRIVRKKNTILSQQDQIRRQQEQQYQQPHQYQHQQQQQLQQPPPPPPPPVMNYNRNVVMNQQHPIPQQQRGADNQYPTDSITQHRLQQQMPQQQHLLQKVGVSPIRHPSPGVPVGVGASLNPHQVNQSFTTAQTAETTNRRRMELNSPPPTNLNSGSANTRAVVPVSPTGKVPSLRKSKKVEAIVRDSNYVGALMRANSLAAFPAPPQLPNYLPSNLEEDYQPHHHDASIVSGLTNPSIFANSIMGGVMGGGGGGANNIQQLNSVVKTKEQKQQQQQQQRHAYHQQASVSDSTNYTNGSGSLESTTGITTQQSSIALLNHYSNHNSEFLTLESSSQVLTDEDTFDDTHASSIPASLLTETQTQEDELQLHKKKQQWRKGILMSNLTTRSGSGMNRGNPTTTTGMSDSLPVVTPPSGAKKQLGSPQRINGTKSSDIVKVDSATSKIKKNLFTSTAVAIQKAKLKSSEEQQQKNQQRRSRTGRGSSRDRRGKKDNKDEEEYEDEDKNDEGDDDDIDDVEDNTYDSKGKQQYDKKNLKNGKQTEKSGAHYIVNRRDDVDDNESMGSTYYNDNNTLDNTFSSMLDNTFDQTLDNQSLGTTVVHDDELDYDDLSVSESIVLRHKAVSENKAGFFERIRLEVWGVIDDTSRSFDQVLSAFTLRPNEIDAVAGRIEKAQRQIATGLHLQQQHPGTSSLSSGTTGQQHQHHHHKQQHRSASSVNTTGSSSMSIKQQQHASQRQQRRISGVSSPTTTVRKNTTTVTTTTGAVSVSTAKQKGNGRGGLTSIAVTPTAQSSTMKKQGAGTTSATAIRPRHSGVV